MPRRKPKAATSFLTKTDPLTRLWVLRILVALGGHSGFVGSDGLNNDTIADAIGLKQWMGGNCDYFDARGARTDLRELHARAEARAEACRVPRALAANRARLAELVGLSSVDCRLLEFAVVLHTDRVLDDAADYLGSLSSTKVARAVATILALPEAAVRSALSSQGLLARSGLLNLDRSGTANLLRHKMDLLSSNFADRMVAAEEDPVALLRDTVAPSRPPTLKLADFAHAAESLDLLLPYLRHALSARRRGVNVFIYGQPGTGKSELVRTVARELECALFEVAYEDEDGNAVQGERRLRAFRAAQSFFTQRRALIVFDETEDVFNDGDGFMGRQSTAQRHKAWINRTLEENPVPALWLSNSAACLDPAFIRRFDLVLELPVPSERQRKHIIGGLCGKLITPGALTRLATAESLAPAVIARAASVVSAIRDELAPERVSSAVERLVENTLVAQGHAPLSRAGANPLPAHYDPRFLNVDADLAAIAEGIGRARSGRLCLYGPPGTGKSAFGRWIADRMNAPLHARRVSDIVSPYVGMTEQRLASAFRQAEQDRAVLLLDEVDSFLQERRGAQHSWEVTAVNEMLVQMESFEGVFIASTNLLEGLDAAALRRFDLKVRFDYLQPAQAWELFVCTCKALRLGNPAKALRARLSAIEVLTPGDFAAAARQHRFRPLESPASLLDALLAECGLKDSRRSASIGFI